jgi:small subunit ribosomal protein S11
MAKQRKSNVVRRSKKTVTSGIVHIQSTFNNTIVSVTDVAGNVLSWCSAGARDFKGSRKSTPYAAQIVAKEAVTQAVQMYGIESVAVHLKGPGAGRESALRAVSTAEVRITSIRDVTPIPHNGCRPSKRRRV